MFVSKVVLSGNSFICRRKSSESESLTSELMMYRLPPPSACQVVNISHVL
uniref:Uncharacterized protein n=1 Tax=Physcomitrium patens TaxID=3218 RepID=A0A2K1IR33_PHYPA|nr:hypothetical protein PHYPA_025863 [Physcomitrium patens]